MKTSNNKQAGFVMVLAAVVAVVAIAIIGVVIWRHNQPGKPMNSATANDSTTSQPAKETTTAATVTPAGTYLDIKEFGIKILLNNSISDAVYSYIPDQPTDGSKIVGISAQSLIDNETNHNSDCIAADAPLGTIAKTVTQPATIKGSVAVDNKSLFKINNFYYQYVRPQGTYQCGITSSGAQDSVVASKLSAFEQAFTTLQPDN